MVSIEETQVIAVVPLLSQRMTGEFMQRMTGGDHAEDDWVGCAEDDLAGRQRVAVRI